MKLDQQKQKTIISAAIYITIGILFCIFRSGMLNILFTIIGALLIAGGIFSLVKKETVLGIITIAVGVAIILFTWLPNKDIILIIIGVIVILKGCYDMVKAILSKSLIGIIFSVITIGIGVCLMLCFWKLMDWFFIVIGVIAIVIGALQLIFTLVDAAKEKPVEEKAE